MIEDKIKKHAKELGFDLVGITTAEPIDTNHIKHFESYLAAENNGKMDWLQKNVEKRFNPALLMPEAKSVLCTAINYKPAKFSKIIASYALYQDYHTVIKQRLSQLADFIKREIDKNLRFKICVDSAPLAEKALALRCGLGFIGKNHLLTNPQSGSFLLLGELIINLKLEPDKQPKQKDYCKDCNKCLDACPTAAISQDKPFDANKCISYLTIEHKGRIPKELKSKIKSVFGCDICLRACPYNQNSLPNTKNDFTVSSKRQKITAENIVELDKAGFEEFFSESAAARTGLRQLKRNAMICLKNQNLK